MAFIVSNESLTAIDWFPYRKINEKLSKHGDHQYNDILRAYYDPLYKLNVECDILPINSSRINDYKLLIVPMLYSATNDELNLLNKYVENGGNILYTFRSGSSDENVKVRTNIQPAILSKSIGAEYKQVVGPEYDTENLIINGQKGLHNLIKQPVKYWMELLEPISANILAKYEHPYWKKYAAITENKYGKGTAFYVGTYLNEESIFQLYKYILKSIGLWSLRQEQRFPIINKILYNHNRKIKLDFYFNYSNNKINVRYSSNKEGVSLFNGNTVVKNKFFLLQPWSLEIFVINN
ncbi:beta-galactosidase [Bombilactobacillus bombi]|uniref:beta-galactosidase n=1 Tax=Bombilactobacillus bombi TaxID=1303590 RepID=UPI00217542AD|nr:beta-galactosidase trimerization domain-containing protein [Bombilactobacillus bombi]